ncbi:MAG TPA: Rho termination factor N-terminal domain-containing protein [Actinomycetota bacterium]|nr:Rho termination factor N-terminal domain-containing protein [Actinomycetota bacterium]
MIEKIARRAGGFASSTALRWIRTGADEVAEIAPTRNGSHKGGGRAVAGAAAGAVALITSSKVARSGIERGLRALADAVRTSSSTSHGNGNGNGNGNGSKDLTAKTRAELYELAKKADLPGRSSMSKDDLAKALKG